MGISLWLLSVADAVSSSFIYPWDPFTISAHASLTSNIHPFAQQAKCARKVMGVTPNQLLKTMGVNPL